MANAPSSTLVLAGTGKTGSRVAGKLTKLGLSVRTAARNGADVRFDWDDPATHRPALVDSDRVYLVAPVMRMDFAGQVSSFLDLAEAAGVPTEYGETLRRLTETVASGHGSRPNSDVQHVTRLPPASFADFARRTAHAWARQGA
jgi:hypothetical protein